MKLQDIGVQINESELVDKIFQDMEAKVPTYFLKEHTPYMPSSWSSWLGTDIAPRFLTEDLDYPQAYEEAINNSPVAVYIQVNGEPYALVKGKRKDDGTHSMLVPSDNDDYPVEEVEKPVEYVLDILPEEGDFEVFVIDPPEETPEQEEEIEREVEDATDDLADNLDVEDPNDPQTSL